MKTCWSVAENQLQDQKQRDLPELGKGPPQAPITVLRANFLPAVGYDVATYISLLERA